MTDKPEAFETPQQANAHAPARKIIRSGDLIPGKRYRIVEIAPWDPSPDLRVGTIVECVDWVPVNGKYKIYYQQFRPTGESDWMASSGAYQWSMTRVSAVELVDDPPEVQNETRAL